LVDNKDDDSLSLEVSGLRPVGMRDVRATKDEKPREFVALDEKQLPKIENEGSDLSQPGSIQIISDRAKKNAATESEQFNNLLESRLAKVKAATVDISKQLDEIELHFTKDDVD
tara:strand:- start:332 stop:673 length:342 start_codon:yes stop_codon:yes gene_type:complete